MPSAETGRSRAGSRPFLPAELLELIASGTNWDRCCELVREASDADLAQLFAEGDRQQILDTVFERCYAQRLASNPDGLDGVVHWHVRDLGGGGDYFQLALGPGVAELGRTLDRAPTLSIEVDPSCLLRVAAQPDEGPPIEEPVRIDGDRRLAAALGYR
jgi:hypothetical protein